MEWSHCLVEERTPICCSGPLLYSRAGAGIKDASDSNSLHEKVIASLLMGLERFSNECRKTKTKVITPANHNKHKLPNEPIRTRSKYM